MSLNTFLNTVKNKRLESQLAYINHYKKVHDCEFNIMFHDNGILIIDPNKNLCVLDLILTM